MVEKSAKLLARNLKVYGNKGVFPSRQSKGDLAEDLSDISDAEVAENLSNNKEFILKKRAWELMNPEYQKGKYRKVTTKKKKDPANKIAPSKKTSATKTKSNAETENKKRPSLEINYNVLDKLFDPENSPKRAKLDKPVVVGDQIEYSKQNSEESLLKSQYSEEEEEEEEEPDWNEDYSNEDAYRGNEECYGNDNLEFEDLDDDEEDDEGVIW
ncbi:Brf1 TBP-binding domain [Arabidopsis suecica]|uniref:Brf1 TBP-binding domain n=1 Tax=Arabidopsis suecica TaxID=45249 RepID=A0A8T2EA55_ARASU|nr:Brf1 TBP-binding domain [Arabidopsis suecica]